jgi:hypothetical protein
MSEVETMTEETVVIDDAGVSNPEISKALADRLTKITDISKVTIFSVPKGVIPHPTLMMAGVDEPKPPLWQNKKFLASPFIVGMPTEELARLYDWHKASAGKNFIVYLKAMYFDQVKAGTKPWEYRECKEYWRKRLEGKTFDFVEIRGGSWGEKRTPENTLFFPWRGYEIKEITHPLFGNIPTKVYAIKLVK